MNFMRRFFEELPWRVAQQFILEDDSMTISESYPAIHLEGLSNRILSEIGIMFSGTKTFCFENSVFSHLA